MSVPQWLFHYEECMRERDRKSKILNGIISALELFSTFSHKDIKLEKIFEGIQKRSIERSIAGFEDKIEDEVRNLMENIPKNISVKEDKQQQRAVAKTMKVPSKRRKKNEI